MIIVLKQDAPKEKIHEFCTELEGMGLQINDSKGSDTHILGLIGDTKAIACLLYTSPSPRDGLLSRMPSSA